jgi:hypothetical protein
VQPVPQRRTRGSGTTRVLVQSKSSKDLGDGLLLRDYDPARSFAWPGAAPPSVQLDLWWGGAEPLIEDQAGMRSPFRKAGYSVRRLVGPGSATTMDEFCRNHHRYLRTRGMAGQGFGLYAPTGELVGVANFAACSNAKTAMGMQAAHVPEDADLTPQQLAHVTIGEREYLDCVRLCTVEELRDGTELGTGAESFLYASCLQILADRNRATSGGRCAWPSWGSLCPDARAI